MRGPRTAMKSGPHLPQLEKAQSWGKRFDYHILQVEGGANKKDEIN